jgi:hypothetical protein
MYHLIYANKNLFCLKSKKENKRKKCFKVKHLLYLIPSEAPLLYGSQECCLRNTILFIELITVNQPLLDAMRDTR